MTFGNTSIANAQAVSNLVSIIVALAKILALRSPWGKGTKWTHVAIVTFLWVESGASGTANIAVHAHIILSLSSENRRTLNKIQGLVGRGIRNYLS